MISTETLREVALKPLSDQAKSDLHDPDFFHRLAAGPGPRAEDYGSLNGRIWQLGRAIENGVIARDTIKAWWREVSERHLAGSVQHFVTSIPHGYYGDFEIIDKIYREEVHPDPRLGAWDRFFHSQAAPEAVRNRKAYLRNLISTRLAAGPLRVLNIGSGPGRDMLECFQHHPGEALSFDCVDQDAAAIRWAQRVCAEHLHAIRFHCQNAFRFPVPATGYGLVWSAGLFDYLNDRLFIRLLQRLIRCAAPGGEVVIGNFGLWNPSRNYMELMGGWELIHRTEEELTALAVQAGALPDQIVIGREPAGVNLFLHIQIPAPA